MYCCPYPNDPFIARIVDVYDGDTLTVSVKFSIFTKDESLMTIRIYGIDTEEIRGVDEERKEKGLTERDDFIKHLTGFRLSESDETSHIGDVKDYFKNNPTFIFVMPIINEKIKSKITTYDNFGRLLAVVEPFLDYREYKDRLIRQHYEKCKV